MIKLKLYYYRMIMRIYYEIYTRDIFRNNEKKMISIMMFIFGIFSTIIFGTIATVRHNEIEYPPLLDILHKDWKIPVWIPDYLCIYFVMDNIFNIVVGNINLYKYIRIWGIYYTLRGITIYITHIPNAMECVLKNDDISNKIFYPSLVYCSDMMFSGHFFYGMYSYKFREGYIKNKNKNRIIMILYGLSIIISRLHYSIDIIMAYIVFMYLYMIN